MERGWRECLRKQRGWGHAYICDSTNGAALFFLIVVLLLNAYFSNRAISQLVESEKWLAHTYTVLSAIDSLEFRLQDSQTSADDFVIAEKPENLASFRDYMSQADARILLLRDSPKTI